MKIKTLEKYIRYSTTPYGDLLTRAAAGGLNVKKRGDGVVVVSDGKKTMQLFFENDAVFESNLNNGLKYTLYNYSK